MPNVSFVLYFGAMAHKQKYRNFGKIFLVKYLVKSGSHVFSFSCIKRLLSSSDRHLKISSTSFLCLLAITGFNSANPKVKHALCHFDTWLLTLFDIVITVPYFSTCSGNQ